MAQGKVDAYANKAFGELTLSAANTLTFAQIQMGVGLFQGTALIVHRIKWSPHKATCRELVAATDSLYMALTTSNRLASIYDVSEPAIIDRKAVIGVGADVALIELPFVSDFTSLPSGGKLVPANPLWVAGVTDGFAAAAVLRVEIEFTFVELKSDQYLELLQALYPANIS
jgi:hypothetical protein